jgi:hypothetical protein
MAEHENVSGSSAQIKDKTSQGSPPNTDTNFDRVYITATVRGAMQRLGADRNVYAIDLAIQILIYHAEYGNKKSGDINADLDKLIKTWGPDSSGQSKAPAKSFPAGTWLQMVESLLKPSIPAINGRVILIGLSLLDEPLRSVLQKDAFLDDLISEMKFDLKDHLSKEGLEFYTTVIERTGSSDMDYASSKIDSALVTEENDKLDRKSFARFLVKLISNVELNDGAYTMHLYAPWGAGKTTVLNFMKQELGQIRLGKKPAWHLVDFNAWQNQNLSFPWWTLMNSVYEAVKKHLKWKHRIREWWWRFKIARIHYLFALVIISWLIVWLTSSLQRSQPDKPQPATQISPRPANAGQQGNLPAITSPQNKTVSPLKEIFENLDKIIAAVLSIWAFITGLSRGLFQGSGKTAENYLNSQQDPMNHFKKRFKTLVAEAAPSKIAIFIDDLDRCKSSFVLDLLESIQTLFKDANVLFVVAADKKWVHACYEVEYEKIKSFVNAQGKSIGPLFTEKMFQLSVALPGAPSAIKDSLWCSMLGIGQDAGASAASINPKKVDSVESRERLLLQANAKPFLENHSIRLKIMDMLAEKKVLMQTEHFLKPYGAFMDLNPRNMKRLLNNYTVNKASSLISHIDVNFHELVLWTILTIRWPNLAEYVSTHIDTLVSVNASQEVPLDIQNLLRDEEVRSVLSGGAIKKPLTVVNIQKCRQLFM